MSSTISIWLPPPPPYLDYIIRMFPNVMDILNKVGVSKCDSHTLKEEPVTKCGSHIFNNYMVTKCDSHRLHKECVTKCCSHIILRDNVTKCDSHRLYKDGVTKCGLIKITLSHNDPRGHICVWINVRPHVTIFTCYYVRQTYIESK